VPRQNRATPFGEIIATTARGTFMGNRGGCFHDAEGNLTASRWVSTHWLICVLDYKGKRRRIMTPGEYTELFFLDEATALAAGHRPCALCRRSDFNRFVAAWRAGNPDRPLGDRAVVNDLDRQLHAERTTRTGEKVTYGARIDVLPDGTFVTLLDARQRAYLVWAGALHGWEPDGYVEKLPKPTATDVIVLTPRSTVGALAAGYRPTVHASSS
jgi:hypothetical protein